VSTKFSALQLIGGTLIAAGIAIFLLMVALVHLAAARDLVPPRQYRSRWQLALSRLALVTLATGAGFVVWDYYIYGG
jgi:hypothetical protein